VARQLLRTRVLTVASPAYLEKHGWPKQPADLTAHSCIQYHDPITRRPFEWEFRRGRKVVPVEPGGRILVNDAGTTLATCLAGIGIAQVFALGLKTYLDQGDLVELFPDWPDEDFPLYAFYPSRYHLPAKVRAFIDFCTEIIS
jgi:DNA-binding transcriptional LysR family regulator